MTDFVDPRQHPEPPVRVSREPAAHGEELRELVPLCRAGRVYEVERWIHDGRPFQAVTYKTPKKPAVETPLRAAVRTNHRDLVLLLLCNGYRLDLEPQGWDSALNVALGNRAFDLLELLLKWGADPKDVDLGTLFDTYKSDLFARFQDFGIDLTRGHALAQALADHTSNRPLFGFAKRHRESNPNMQTELNIALVRHVSEENEKGVQLCLWAGADPHAPALSLRFWRGSANGTEDEFGVSAVYEACARGNVVILKRLGPDPERDDFDELYQAANSRAVIDLLAKKALPSNIGPVIQHHLWWSTFDHWKWSAIDTLERLFEIGMRWTQSSPVELADLRRCLLKASDSVFVDLMKLLAWGDRCSPELLKELARTPSMLARMKQVGFFPPSEDDPKRFSKPQPSRSRDVLKKFGVQLPKPPPPLPLPPFIWVGSRNSSGSEIKMGRTQLFERVWSEPVASLAAEWGISGPGLKKVCRKLQIPVPARGYWAKRKAGHRTSRPRLPGLPGNAAPEIIIRAP
jgi:hypothetical protein